MKCDDAQQLIQEQFDGLLLPLDRAALTEHVGHCPPCMRERARLTTLVRGFTALPAAEHVPHNFTSSVMAALPEMLPAQEGAGHVVRSGIGVAAALVAFVGGLAMLPAMGGPDIARETLSPLAASLQLDGALAGQALLTLARTLDATAAVLADTSLGAKLAFVLAFLGVLSALSWTLQSWRAQLAPNGVTSSGRRA